MQATRSLKRTTREFGGAPVSVLVLVILGLILWMLLVPREGGPERRYISAVKSDLKNLGAAQEEYYERYGTYASRYEEIVSAGTFMPSSGVTIAVTTGTDSAWSAVGRHEAAPDDVCTMHVGGTGPYDGRKWRPEYEGEPVCRSRRDLRRAAKGVERTCEDGHAASCYHAAVLIAGGWGADRDSSRAAGFFELACAGSSAAGCTALGTLYAEGSGVPRDIVRADSALRRACRAGNPTGCGGVDVALAEQACARGEATGCIDLGNRFRAGQGVAQNRNRAAGLFGRACAGGDQTGCARLIQLAREHRMEHDDPRTMFWVADLYEQACRAGASRGCSGLTELATGYWLNRPGPASGGIAAGLLEQACSGGDRVGCSEAIAFYERACTDDEAWACSRLGDRYRAGRGVPHDPARAASLISQACDGGSTADCFRLATMLLAGEGIARDSARAAALFRAACDKGILNACNYVRPSTAR